MNPSESQAAPEFRPGDWVEIRGMARVGQIIEVDARRKTARVLVGDQEWRLKLRELRPTDPPATLPPVSSVRVSTTGPLCEAIDLHGMRVEEALILVDRTLDQAVVHRLREVRIVHGFGTGAVRNAVRGLLQHHPHVAHFHFGGPIDGGLGCTIVEIRQAKP